MEELINFIYIKQNGVMKLITNVVGAGSFFICRNAYIRNRMKEATDMIYPPMLNYPTEFNFLKKLIRFRA